MVDMRIVHQIGLVLDVVGGMKALGTVVGTYINLDWLHVLLLFPFFAEKIYPLRSNSCQDCAWFAAA